MTRTKILVCEDEQVWIKRIMRPWQPEINKGNYALIIATSGEEGLKILEEDKDLEIKYCILDLRMPIAQEDGEEFYLKFLDYRSDLKLIIYTAWLEEYAYLMENEASLNVGENLLGIYWKRQFSPRFIKELIEMYVEADSSKLTESEEAVKYKSLSKLFEALAPKQKIKMIKELFTKLDLSTAEQLQSTIAQDITKAIDIIKEKRQKDKLRQWVIAKIQEGILDPSIPSTDITTDFVLEERFQNGDGPYYYLRYKSPKDRKWTYLYLNKYGSLINSLPLECARRYYLRRKSP